MLNVPSRIYIGMDEFLRVGLIPVDNIDDQVKLNHAFDIYNDRAPEYITCQFLVSTKSRYEEQFVII